MIIGRRSLTDSEINLACQELERKRISWVNWGNLELRLVGLLDADLLTLGLGLLLPSDWERRQIIIHTPLPSRLLDRVKFCRLGKIRLDFTGQELPIVKSIIWSLRRARPTVAVIPASAFSALRGAPA